MVKYGFKSIPTVPKASEFIDIVLTKTQRKTPTVIHPDFKISRIRNFYKRKIKFTQQTCQEKLQEIIQAFPRLDDIHPFYSDLINVLYDKDHYKLALGQLNTAKTLVGQIADNYVRLIKYADTLYRAKQLKRAALGRMCTLLKKQNSSFCYLDEVRKHLARLPSIDPTTRTLLICGFPNVGKSSFMNKVTRANVDVQPYAFTTKSLFVGHMDYEYLRWQVIDTPGILDHSLEERNTIEMQSITALAHLHCSVLYFIDISCECGYTIEQQLSLFENIKPLFTNKPVFLVCNKIDVQPFEKLVPMYQQMIELSASQGHATLMKMSGLEELGISEVRNAACQALLEQRIEKKKQTSRAGDVRSRLVIVAPKPRDDKVRSACIPESVKLYAEAGALPKTVFSTGREGRREQEELERKRDESGIPRRTTQKEIQWQRGGPGVYAQELYEHYKGMLKTDEWMTDIIPEIMDGKNIADFYDPEIEEKLQRLEEEEERLQAEFQQEEEADPESDLDSETEGLHKAIKSKQKIMKERKKLKTSLNYPVIPRGKKDLLSPGEVKSQLDELNMDSNMVPLRGKKRTRSVLHEELDEEEIEKLRTHNRREPASATSITGEPAKRRAKKLLITSQSDRNREGKQGEADRVIQDRMPKYLFTGKRGIGKTDWR